MVKDGEASEWSKTFSLDAVGSEGIFSCKFKQSQQEYQVHHMCDLCSSDMPSCHINSLCSQGLGLRCNSHTVSVIPPSLSSLSDGFNRASVQVCSHKDHHHLPLLPSLQQNQGRRWEGLRVRPMNCIKCDYRGKSSTDYISDTFLFCMSCCSLSPST